jgi:UDP-N-acetylmuramoyl-L-alanyl-D-glutamate--2,6-diaminopimelate ligase
VLVVDSPRAVLGEVSARDLRHHHLTLRMLGITGTNGKTTTAYLVHSALTALGAAPVSSARSRPASATSGSTACAPLPRPPNCTRILAVMAQRGLGTCVMEVSSHALAQHRVDGVVYDVALFTNLSQDHLDFHDGMEDYFAAKASLFTPQRPGAGWSASTTTGVGAWRARPRHPRRDDRHGPRRGGHRGLSGRSARAGTDPRTG